jgi:hypothetical protein
MESRPVWFGALGLELTEMVRRLPFDRVHAITTYIVNRIREFWADPFDRNWPPVSCRLLPSVTSRPRFGP